MDILRNLVRFHTKTDRAARLAPLEACVEENFVKPLDFCGILDGTRAWDDDHNDVKLPELVKNCLLCHFVFSFVLLILLYVKFDENWGIVVVLPVSRHSYVTIVAFFCQNIVGTSPPSMRSASPEKLPAKGLATKATKCPRLKSCQIISSGSLRLTGQKRPYGF